MIRVVQAAVIPALVFALVASGGTAADYTTLDGAAEPLRAAFNADRGQVRLVMYVSPTCGGCLRGAKQMQERVLDRVGDDRVTVYVVWGPKNGARERHVERVTSLVTDERAAHYWDGAGVVSRAYDDMLTLAGPCAGIFMLYGPDVAWEAAAPPRPLYLEDAHAREFDRPYPQLDADRFAERLRTLLNATS